MAPSGAIFSGMNMLILLLWPTLAALFYAFRVDVSAHFPSLALHFPSFALAIWLVGLASFAGLPRKFSTLFNLLLINTVCEVMQLQLAGATFDVWDLAIALFTTLLVFYFYMPAARSAKTPYANICLWSPALLATLGCEESMSAHPVFTPRSEVLAEINYSTAAHTYAFDNVVVWGTHLAILDQYKGVAILDNTDPLQPVYEGYINVPAAAYLAVQDNMLWINHYNDFVYFTWDAELGVVQAGRLEKQVSYYDYFDIANWVSAYGDSDDWRDRIPEGMVVTGYYRK